METKKSVVLRKAFIGMLIGEFVTTLIPIIISLCIGDGNYYPFPPEFLESCGTPVRAAVTQFLLGAATGAAIGISMLVWESERLSLLSQTAIHFASLVACLMPVAWVCHWMKHSLREAILFAVNFVCVYVAIWLAIHLTEVIKIRKINAKLEKGEG